MKKSITIVGWRRPSFMNQMLESLVKNDLSGWDIYVGIDPLNGPEYEELKAQHYGVIQKHIPQAKIFWRDWHMDLSPHHAIARNIHDITNKAYSNGSEYNIHLEDDVVVSPDVTQLADWYGQNEFENIFCLCFANAVVDAALPDIYGFDTPEVLVVESGKLHREPNNGFHPFALCTRRREWFNFISSASFYDRGWAWGWTKEIGHKKFNTLLPYVTRCDHVGTHGVHIKNGEHNRKKGWGFHEVYNGVVNREDFVLF